MNDDLSQAIEQFPLLSWLQQTMNVRDTGRENLRIQCPVCRSPERTLSVNLQTKFFHCFRCDDGGYGGSAWNGRAGIFKFLSIVENLSPGATAARIRSLAGLPDTPRRKVDAKSTGWPAESLPLTAASAEHPAVKMLASRGVQHLIQLSRVCVSGRFSHRVLLPINFFGTVTGFEAKTYVGATPKSIIEHFTSGSGHVYTTHNWDESCDFCVITESILDAETLGVNAVGLFGSVLGDQQLITLLSLRKRGVRRLVWFLDADAMKKQANMLRQKTGLFFSNFWVEQGPFDILLSSRKDPNALGREQSWKLVQNARHIDNSLDILCA